MKKYFTSKRVAIIKSWALGVVAAAVLTGVEMLTELHPVYKAIILAATIPAVQWANKKNTAFGRGSK